MIKPNLVVYETVDWTTVAASKSTASITWKAGDVIAVLASSEENTDTLSLPTATGLSFVAQQTIDGIGFRCSSLGATAAAASDGSGVVSMTESAGVRWGFCLWVFRNSLGVGHSSQEYALSITTSLMATAVDSAIVWGLFDFGAGPTHNLVPTPSNTRLSTQLAGGYTFMVGDLLDQPLTTAVNYGVDAGSGFSIIAMEVQGTGGSNTVRYMD